MSATPGGLPSHDGYSLFPTTLPPYVAAVMFETFLYGIYLILFAICVYVLLRRKRTLHWVLLASAIAMFSIASADIGYTYYLVFGKLLNGGLSFMDLRPKYYLYVTNNAFADALLLYRCYVVWDFKKRVVAGPAILLIGGTICGYWLEGNTSDLFSLAWIYVVLTFLLNVLLTSLAAGRIWWIARKARKILGRGLLERYNTTVAILIESGLIYSVYIILDLAMHRNANGNAILDAGLIQVVGIMPTLIIVQVGLGRAVHDIEANNPSQFETSKIEIRSPTLSNFNRSYSEGNNNHQRHRTSHSGSLRQSADTEMRQAACSASSETFILHRNSSQQSHSHHPYHSTQYPPPLPPTPTHLDVELPHRPTCIPHAHPPTHIGHRPIASDDTVTDIDNTLIVGTDPLSFSSPGHDAQHAALGDDDDMGLKLYLEAMNSPAAHIQFESPDHDNHLQIQSDADSFVRSDSGINYIELSERLDREHREELRRSKDVDGNARQ